MLKSRYQINPKIIETDNEIVTVKPQVAQWIENQGITLEPSTPYTQEQNGGAERLGGVIKEKARAMRAGAKLPHFLWSEITRSAVYLYNRTPNYTNNWKSPYETFHTRLAYRDGVVIDHRKPDQTHLRVFGCKAYAMTTTAMKKSNRRRKLDPRAWIGYLVGYRASSIYRVWIPRLNKVITTRDVIFNEEEVFNGDIQSMKDDLLQISEEDFQIALKQATLSDQ